MASLVLSSVHGTKPNGTQCRCGSPLRYVHCPGCGSTNFYAKVGASVTAPINGVDVTLRGFKCRKCTIDFFDGQPCEAPYFETPSMAKRREQENAQAQMKAAQQACLAECIANGMSQHDAEMEWIKRLLKMREVVGKEPQ